MKKLELTNRDAAIRRHQQQQQQQQKVVQMQQQQRIFEMQMRHIYCCSLSQSSERKQNAI